MTIIVSTCQLNQPPFQSHTSYRRSVVSVFDCRTSELVVSVFDCRTSELVVSVFDCRTSELVVSVFDCRT